MSGMQPIRMVTSAYKELFVSIITRHVMHGDENVFSPAGGGGLEHG